MCSLGNLDRKSSQQFFTQQRNCSLDVSLTFESKDGISEIGPGMMTAGWVIISTMEAHMPNIWPNLWPLRHLKNREEASLAVYEKFIETPTFVVSHTSSYVRAALCQHHLDQLRFGVYGERGNALIMAVWFKSLWWTKMCISVHERANLSLFAFLETFV